MKEVLGLEATRKLLAISISNDTVQRKVIDIAVVVEEQLFQPKKFKCFAILRDESPIRASVGIKMKQISMKVFVVASNYLDGRPVQK